MHEGLRSQSIPTSEQLEANPALLGEQQTVLGDNWASIYSDTNEQVPDESAEIVLRNPASYLRHDRVRELPEELQTKWANLLGISEAVAKHAAVGAPAVWVPGTSGLDKIQNLVESGRISASYRGSVADIMRNSSALFAESINYSPGDTHYYAGNVVGAAGWLKHKQ